MASFFYYYQNPSGFCFLVQNLGFYYFNLNGINKFKYERKHEMNSGLSSKKAVIVQMAYSMKALSNAKQFFVSNVL